MDMFWSGGSKEVLAFPGAAASSMLDVSYNPGVFLDLTDIHYPSDHEIDIQHIRTQGCTN